MNRSFNPPPWKLDGDVIRDASGGVVISAFNPCNTAVRKMIVESVNTMAALKEAGSRLALEMKPFNITPREAAAAEAVTQAVKAIDPHALPPFHEEYAIKTTQGYVWTGETVEERRLFKTREGAEELKARMEAEDAKYMACHQPKRTIVRRVVGEWEDA